MKNRLLLSFGSKFVTLSNIVRILFVVSLCLIFISVSVLAKEKRKKHRTPMSTQFISVSAGWNLMSVPLSPANGDKDTLFPSATSFTFIYQNGYVPVDTLQHGQGFWVKFDSSEVIQFTGNTVLGDTINLHAGWNLIGSLSTSVAVNSIHSLPDSLVSSYYFVYIPGAGYQPIDTLHPGFGYWVNARDSGSIVLSWKEVVLSDSTKNAETFSNLTNVSLDSNHVTLTFDNVDNIPTIEPGTILVSDSGGGFARRVIGSTVKGNQLTVETEMASYDEVVDIARVDTSFELVFPDISVLNKLLGKPILSSGVVGSKTYSISTSTPSIALSPNARLLTLRFPNFNLAVNNGSGQVSVSADTVTFSLEATIQSFDFEFYFGLETFRFVTQMATSIRFVNMQILLSGVIETTDSIPLIPHPIILGIIPTPIVGLVLTPEFNLFAGLSPSFSLNGGLETNGAVEMNGTMQTGFEYANGDFNPVWNPNVTGSVQSAFEPTGS
ncbi:MAG: hypothetical protein HYZ33_02335, partial [Ignavibacteriales bacterium]|nr:hypothetical protein [Ignavibacteriales bacterium]